MREIWHWDGFKIEDHQDMTPGYLKIVYDDPRHATKIIEEEEAQLIRKILDAWDTRLL